MPDEHISNTLHTHPPDPDFVASTRTMLRAAWNEPLPQQAPPNHRPGGGGVGHISRWMAGGAAAGLLVVAIGAIVVLGRGRAADNTEAISTVAPTLATVDTVGAGQPGPATPPPTAATPPPTAMAVLEPSTTVAVTVTQPEATTTTDGTAAASGGPPDSQPAPTTPTTLPPTTTTSTEVTTPLPPDPVYIRREVPEWALRHVTDPFSKYPDPGVYGAKGAKSDQTVDLARVFVGDECLDRFESKEPGACRDGYAYEDDPQSRTVKLDDGTVVLAPFNTPDEGVVWYEIPASEFSNLLSALEPDPKAPPGIELVWDAIGQYGVFQTFEGHVEELVYPYPLGIVEEG